MSVCLRTDGRMCRLECAENNSKCRENKAERWWRGPILYWIRERFQGIAQGLCSSPGGESLTYGGQKCLVSLFSFPRLQTTSVITYDRHNTNPAALVGILSSLCVCVQRHAYMCVCVCSMCVCACFRQTTQPTVRLTHVPWGFHMAQAHKLSSTPAEGNLHVKMAAHRHPGFLVVMSLEGPRVPLVHLCVKP